MKNKIFFVVLFLFGVINNNLYSQVCPNCVDPVVYESNITSHSVDLNWDYDPYVGYYIIRYKEANSSSSSNNPWIYSSNIYINSYQIDNLQLNTSYQYQIRSYCSNYNYGWSFVEFKFSIDNSFFCKPRNIRLYSSKNIIWFPMESLGLQFFLIN